MAVEDGDEFQALAANAIGDDVGGVGYHKLPCAQQSARSAHVRLSLKEFDSIENALGYKCCVLL